MGILGQDIPIRDIICISFETGIASCQIDVLKKAVGEVVRSISDLPLIRSGVVSAMAGEAARTVKVCQEEQEYKE